VTAVRSPLGALLCATRAQSGPAGLVLVLHGGDEEASSRCRWWYPAVLRCRLLAWDVALRSRGRPFAVYRLQHARTGWEGDGGAPLADLDWALDEIARIVPGVPVTLLGHSMGARTAARRAGRRAVTGLVGLAPWLLDDDPVAQLAGRRLDIIEGTHDRVVLPATVFARRAGEAGAVVTRRTVVGGGHMMLRHLGRWHRNAATLTAAQLDGAA
jgi:hypothetical protein